MTAKELKDIIIQIVESYLVDVWLTPYFVKKYIPSENIPKMEEKLVATLLKECNKKGGRKSNG